MPRADWGGNNDYSGLFAGLAREQQNELESRVARGARKAEEQQNADDAERYDQWKKGLITDAEWLEYIRSRVKDTADDPQENQRWIETLREHTDSIADSQAETAFENGETSIHQLISHYQNRKKGLKVNSPEWRDLAKRINELSDKRDSDDIYTGAEAIIDGIDRGTHTYGDLKKFYQSKLRAARPNSDLHQQLTRELAEVDDQLYEIGVTEKLEGAQYRFSTGKMSGSAYASLLRSEAQRYRENNPAKYYQLLAAADQAAGYGAGSYGGGGGGRRRSGGGGGGRRSSGGFSGTRVAVRGSDGALTPEAYTGTDPLIPINEIMFADSSKETVDGWFADLDRIETIWEMLDKNPNATEFYDPFSGQVIQLTPETINAIDNQYLRTQDAITAEKWATGDRDGATQAQKNKTAYIYNTMMPHNTLPVDTAIQRTVNNLTTRYNIAMQEPDPFARAQQLADVASDVEKVEERALFNVTTGKTFVSRRDYIRAMRMDRGDINETQRQGAHEDVTLTLRQKGPSQGIDPVSAQELAALRMVTTALGDPSLSEESRRELLAEATDMSITNKFKYLDEDTIDNWALGPKGKDAVAGATDDRTGGALSTYVEQQMLMDGTGVFVQRGGRIEVMEAVPALVGRSDGRSVERLEPSDMHAGQNSVPRTLIYMNVNGRPVQVWAEVQTEYSNRSVFRVAADFKDPFGDEDAIHSAGDILTSSDLQNMDEATVRQWIAQGKIYREAMPIAASVVIGNQKWVQDPETKLWYKNKLPLAAERADRFGGLSIDDEGNPELRYKPHASAGGVPIPFDPRGTTPKQMQAIFNQMVENGDIDPGDYMQRDANGAPLYQPIDMSKAYYDPADRRWEGTAQGRTAWERKMPGNGTERSPMGRTAWEAKNEPDTWQERSERKIKEAAEAWVKETLSSREQARWRHNDVDPAQFAIDRIKRYGEAVGLKVGAGGTIERRHADNLRELETNRGIPNMDALRRANRRAEGDERDRNQTRLAKLPKLAPVRAKLPSRMPELPDPQRSSGPALTRPAPRTMPRTAMPMPRTIARTTTAPRRTAVTPTKSPTTNVTRTPIRRKTISRY